MTNEQKNKMIDDRIAQHEVKIFSIELDLVALRLANDTEMVKQLEKSAEILNKAIDELERMKVM